MTIHSRLIYLFDILFTAETKAETLVRGQLIESRTILHQNTFGLQKVCIAITLQCILQTGTFPPCPGIWVSGA